MQRFSLNLVGWTVSVAVLSHALAGCCTHHAHAALGELACDMAQPCHDHHANHGADNQPGEHDGVDCEDGRCVLQASGERTGLERAAVAAFGAGSLDREIASPSAAFSGRLDANHIAPGRFALSVRAHLAVSVLQI